MYRRTRSKKNKIEEIVPLDSSIVPLDASLIPLDSDMCLICLEPCEETNKLFKMQDIVFLNALCKCNGKFHVNCLVNWSKVSKTCPICRIQLTINLDILNQLDYMYKTTVLVQFRNYITNGVSLFYAVMLLIITQYMFFICFKTSYFIVQQLLHNSENRI
jgi:hypothetical protein